MIHLSPPAGGRSSMAERLHFNSENLGAELLPRQHLYSRNVDFLLCFHEEGTTSFVVHGEEEEGGGYTRVECMQYFGCPEPFSAEDP